jgi:hypothetical protein
MAQVTLHQREDAAGPVWPEVYADAAVGAGCEVISQLSGIARVAVGRLGGQIAPWLDESLLMTHGLITLLEMTGGAGISRSEAAEEDALRRVVDGLRGWIRSGSWYQSAWLCRVGPLCAAVSAGGGDDAAVARDLGLQRAGLVERFVEAGLVFAVSPELLLPRRDASLAIPLARSVDALPPRQRRVLTLYFRDGLSFPEMAELLGIAPARAQELYGRAAVAICGSLLAGQSHGEAAEVRR